MTTPNPFLKTLGLGPDDRAVIIHADDIGMCGATVEAYADLADVGIVTCGSVMPPCSWFPAAAAYARDRESADLGVHLTLTCEWDGYRWGPLSTRDPASGLVDGEGYLPRTSREVQEQAGAQAVEAELRAQMDRVLASGIRPTHVDTHMGTVAHPKFIRAYVDVARDYGVVPFMIRNPGIAGRAVLGEGALALDGPARELEAAGLPLMDGFSGMPLGRAPEDAGNRLSVAKAAFDALPLGLSHFFIHPAKDGAEIRAIAPDWRCRVADYETFGDPALGRFCADKGIHLIGYRHLRGA